MSWTHRYHTLFAVAQGKKKKEKKSEKKKKKKSPVVEAATRFIALRRNVPRLRRPKDRSASAMKPFIRMRGFWY